MKKEIFIRYGIVNEIIKVELHSKINDDEIVVRFNTKGNIFHEVIRINQILDDSIGEDLLKINKLESEIEEKDKELKELKEKIRNYK